MTSWIEVTRDEQRLARIEAMACRSAGLPVDPLVAAIAKAEPHTPEWIAQQGEEEPTNDISEAMNTGLTTMIQAERRRAVSMSERVARAGHEPEAEQLEWRRDGQLARRPQPAASRGSWLSRLFGR